MIHGVEKLRKACVTNKSKILNNSIDEDNSIIDLTQEEDFSSEEKEKRNNANIILLGKKTQRKKGDNKDHSQKIKKMDIIEDNISTLDKSILSDANSINLDTDNSNNRIEKEKLLDLVKNEGFNTIFNLLSNSDFNKNNPTEKELEKIIEIMGLLRVTLFLLQIKFSSSSNPNPEENKKKEKNQNTNETYNLGEHLHKEIDGNIYKYYKNYLRIKGFVFRCADRTCKSTGLYNLKTMNFKVLTAHTIQYDQHDYIKKKEKYEKYKTIFEDFKKRNCTEAQVFQNGDGDKLVKWYNTNI